MTFPLLQATLPPLTQPVIVGVALVYFVIVAAIGVWATRRTKNANDFFVAGEGIGLWTLAIASMASTISGFAFIGGPGLVYSIGIGALFLVLPAAITNTMGCWVLAKRLRLLGEIRGLITIPDAIGVRYKTRFGQGISAVSIVVATIGYTATNVLALGLVITAVFGVGRIPGIWIGSAIILSYSASGGILAGVYTDLFEGAVKAVASVLVFAYVLMVGGGMSGMSHSIMAADATYLGPWGKIGPMAALSFFFVFGVGSLGQPHVVHKFYMLRDPRRLKWLPLIVSCSLIVSLLLYFGVGIAMRALVAGGRIPALASPDDATPTFLLHFTPIALAALVFSGVAAAIMSTVNSFLSIGAAALTHDIPVAFGTRVKDELLVGRLTTVVIAVLAALVAQGSGALVAFLGIFGWGLFASTLVPSLAIGLNWKGATRAGAVGSIVTGLVCTLLFETLAYMKAYKLPAGVTASGLSLVMSFLVFFALSWLTRDTAEATLDPDIRAVMEA